MSWAFDYDEMLNTICHGLYQPGQGTFHPTTWVFPKDAPEPYHQDLDKAEDLLDEAGWIDSDGDGIRDKEIDGRRVPFEFTLLTYQTETGLQASMLMKESLEQIGVICNVKPTEFTVLMRVDAERTFDAAMGGWGAGTDPDTTANIYGTGEPRNYGQYSNPRGRQAVRTRPARVRPRQAGRDLRRDSQACCGRISPTPGCSIATRSTPSTRSCGATTSAHGAVSTSIQA